MHEAIKLHPFFFIPGKHAPGHNMDVYFQPLIEDLLEMFVNGVRTYDPSKGEHFQLRAAVLWTILVNIYIALILQPCLLVISADAIESNSYRNYISMLFSFDQHEPKIHADNSNFLVVEDTCRCNTSCYRL